MKAKSRKKKTFVYVCGVEYQHELGTDGGAGPYEVFNSLHELKTHVSCWRQCGIVKVELKNAKWIVAQDLGKTGSAKTTGEKRNQRLAFERKLRDYGHFLKHDADYDGHFIVRLLRFKLERTRKCILDNNIIEDAAKVGREIQAVVTLLKRVEEDRYFEELHKPFFKKYGNPRMITGKPDGRGTVPVTVRYYKETPRNRKQRIRESLRLAKKEEQMRREDLKKALRLIEKNIWNWWD